MQTKSATDSSSCPCYCSVVPWRTAPNNWRPEGIGCRTEAMRSACQSQIGIFYRNSKRHEWADAVGIQSASLETLPPTQQAKVLQVKARTQLSPYLEKNVACWSAPMPPTSVQPKTLPPFWLGCGDISINNVGCIGNVIDGGRTTVEEISIDGGRFRLYPEGNPCCCRITKAIISMQYRCGSLFSTRMRSWLIMDNPWLPSDLFDGHDGTYGIWNLFNAIATAA